MNSSFRHLRAGLLVLLCGTLLAACANVGPVLSALLSNRLAFTPAELQRQLDQRFPRDYQKANGLVTLRVMHPRLSIVPGTTRLRLDFDVGVGALGRAPQSADSHFAVSSGIRFDLQRMGLMLDAPAVENVDLRNLGMLNSPARDALNQWLADYAEREPVYTLDAQTQQQLRGRTVESAYIRDGQVVIDLIPAQPGTPVGNNDGWTRP